MKLTKVENMRIAVKREEKGDGSGRAVLYLTPKYKKVGAVEKQVEARIFNANRLYNVFFKSDVPFNLENLFEGLVKELKTAKADCAENVLFKYTGTTDKRGKRIELNKFSYSPSGKSIGRAMELYVRERMSDEWQTEVRRKTAVAVLCCLCGGKRYKDKVSHLSQEIINDFIEICRESKTRVFVHSTRNLENAFSDLMKKVAVECKVELYKNIERTRMNEEIEKNICAQIEIMKSLSSYKTKENGKEVEKLISEISHRDAVDDRIDAVVERMRKTLKRGKRREIAIALLRGLAQMNGKRWKDVIEEMMQDTEKRAQLIDFIYAVNKDYYRMNIMWSVKHINVKVQSSRPEAEGENLNPFFQLSSSGNPKKRILNETLVTYAKSKEDADNILQSIKRLLFQYFLRNDRCQSEDKYFSEKGLWNFPEFLEEYLDTYFVTDVREDKPEAKNTLAVLSEKIGDKRSDRNIKCRIRYVNYGIYKSMLTEYADEFSIYWITFIKEFVEKNYVQKSKLLSNHDLYSTTMMKKCWKSIIQMLCGKYIAIGKAVYHWAMPKQMEPVDKVEYGIIKGKYKRGLSSFDYEEIKAEENLQKDIAGAVVTALFNFSSSVLDYDKDLEEDADIVTMNQEILTGVIAEDAKKKVLRYFGGMSNCCVLKNVEDKNLVLEIREMLGAIRNKHFHYAPGKRKDFTYELIEKLFKNDIHAYVQIVKDKYYKNNVALFYPAQDIQKLVEKFYSVSHFREAQIPAFRTIFKRVHLTEYLTDIIEGSSWGRISEKQSIFEGAIYFLLKEIYYQDFSVGSEALEYFFQAVNDYFKEQGGGKFEKDGKIQYVIQKDCKKGKYFDAAKSFLMYTDKLQKQVNSGGISFGNVCQAVLTEYNQQNSKQNKGEAIYKHYKLLFGICMRNAFIKYVKDHYEFIRKPALRNGDKQQCYLEQTEIGCLEYFSQKAFSEDDLRKRYMWYTLAHFISPRHLNFLIGDLKNYMQFRNDIMKRAVDAKEIDEEEKKQWEEEISYKANDINEILQVLEFVREIAGRVSNEISDYYGKDNEEQNAEDNKMGYAEKYAKFLHQYIDFEVLEGCTVFNSLKGFCQDTLPNGEKVDIYVDDKNPKVMRNVELARMYGGGDIYLEGHQKVSVSEIREYYKNLDKVQKLLSKEACDSKEEQTLVRRQQELKERITLNDITNISKIITDLHAHLVSLSYMRERDEMYLFLGFYYLALQNPEGWKEGNWKTFKFTSGKNEVEIQSGFVLYQIVSIFDFGLDFRYESDGKSKKRGGQISGKLTGFANGHKQSLACVLRLFEKEKEEGNIIDVRNYVDHFKYYYLHDKSIMDLYNDYYERMFDYSNMLRKSVWSIFQSTLEKEHVLSQLQICQRGEKYIMQLENDGLVSDKFTYKLSNKRDVEIDARSNNFLSELEAILEYKKEER